MELERGPWEEEKEVLREGERNSSAENAEERTIWGREGI